MTEERLFQDGSGRQYRLRRQHLESDAAYDARIDKLAQHPIIYEDPDERFDQVVFIEQDRRRLRSEIAELEGKLRKATGMLEAADAYLDADEPRPDNSTT
jgi:hypothetical protein